MPIASATAMPKAAASPLSPRDREQQADAHALGDVVKRHRREQKRGTAPLRRKALGVASAGCIWGKTAWSTMRKATPSTKPPQPGSSPPARIPPPSR